jgi:hypothetical protein
MTHVVHVPAVGSMPAGVVSGTARMAVPDITAISRTHEPRPAPIATSLVRPARRDKIEEWIRR